LSPTPVPPEPPSSQAAVTGRGNEAAATRRPGSCTELFIVFTRLALQGFGGVLPVAQRELVERERWLTAPQFLELLALSQVLPGPNVINLSLMVGQRFLGLRGALSAMAGMLCVPMVGVLLLAALAAQGQRHAMVTGALRGMGIVSAGLITATALKLASPLKRSPLSLPGAVLLGAASFVAVGLLRWPLVAVVFGLGGLAFGWAAWRIGAQAPAPGAPAPGDRPPKDPRDV